MLPLTDFSFHKLIIDVYCTHQKNNPNLFDTIQMDYHISIMKT